MSIRLVPLVVAVGILSACAAAPPASPPETTTPAVDGFSVAELVGALPVADGDALYSVGDVDAVADLVQTPRPTEPGEELVEWMLATSGIRTDDLVSLPWPETLGTTSVATHAEYVAAAGFGIPDVDAFAELAAPPTSIAIFDGRFDVDAITGALGQPVDGIWAQEGEEFAPDLAGPRPIDRLGRPVRITGDEARLALSLERALLEQYRGGPVVGDSPLLDVARILDNEGVYAAQLRVDGDVVAAVGLVAADEGSRAVLVRSGASAVPEEGATDGPFTVSTVDARGDADVILLDIEPGTPPASVWQLLIRGSIPLGI